MIWISILKLLLEHEVMNKTFLNTIPDNAARNSALHYVTAYGSLEDVTKIVELGATSKQMGKPISLHQLLPDWTDHCASHTLDS